MFVYSPTQNESRIHLEWRGGGVRPGFLDPGQFLELSDEPHKNLANWGWFQLAIGDGRVMAFAHRSDLDAWLDRQRVTKVAANIAPPTMEALQLRISELEAELEALQKLVAGTEFKTVAIPAFRTQADIDGFEQLHGLPSTAGNVKSKRIEMIEATLADRAAAAEDDEFTTEE